LCRFLPVGLRSDAESSRWDSFKRRCSARSFLRLLASSVVFSSCFGLGVCFPEGFVRDETLDDYLYSLLAIKPVTDLYSQCNTYQ
jgi:hypothetical protein